MAMVNHSCVPNCCQVVKDGVVVLIALRDIEVGEDISFSYVTIGAGDRGDRGKSIMENWGFVCKCERCEVEGNMNNPGGILGESLRGFDERHICFCGSVNLEVDRSSGECVCHVAA